MALYGEPKSERERLVIKRRSILGRLSRGGIDPNEKARAEARLQRVEEQLEKDQQPSD